MLSPTLTPPEVARHLRVKPAKIIAEIRAGNLEAIDVSAHPGIGRPRYRITAEALERWEARRAVRAATTAKTRKPATAGREWF
jgi:hypothetical protein